MFVITSYSIHYTKLYERLRQWLELLLATPVVLWGGWPFFVRGWNSVKTWTSSPTSSASLTESVKLHDSSFSQKILQSLV